MISVRAFLSILALSLFWYVQTHFIFVHVSDRIHVVCEEKPPQGCAVATVSDKCEVHVLLKVHILLSLNISWDTVLDLSWPFRG